MRREAESRQEAQTVRNLGISQQGYQLTFSDKNIPIDSKRKFRSKTSTGYHLGFEGEGASPATARVLRSASLTQRLGTCGSDALKENVALMNQARDEERRANEEIRNITKSPSCNDNLTDTYNDQPKAGLQSKLHRTCQNQNFDIFASKYPEPKDSLNISRDTSSSRLSPLARQYYNKLFRESPDFILTTSPNLHEERKQSFLDDPIENRQVENSRLLMKGSATDMLPSKKVESYDQNGCACSRLDEDFQYIGSKSGHKYFIEKLFDE